MKPWMLVSAVVGALVVMGFLFFYGSTSRVVESPSAQFPPIGDREMPPIKMKPYTVPNAASTAQFMRTAMERTGYPVRIVSVEPVSSEAADDKIRQIVRDIAFPNVHGRAFRQIVSVSKRCETRESCGTEVAAPSQMGWTEANIAEFRSRMEAFLRDEIKPRDDDLLFRVTWATDHNERFTTYLLTTRDNKPRFETMIYFSVIEKRCSEKQARGAQEADFSWQGDAFNAFGMSVVSWKGHVTYRYQDGKLLTADLCPDKSCLSWTTSRLLWQVDDDATKVKTDSVPNSQPDEKTLGYRIVWSVWLPKKADVAEKLGFEMPPPKGNMAAGSFSIRGDGSWSKN
jgi:hypothetical protein